MIQRIQTLFLLLAALCMAALFAPTLAFVTVEGDTSTMKNAAQSMMADGLFNIYDHVLILALVGLAAIVVFINIFFFRNRTLQLRINRVAMAAGILVILLAGIFFYQDYQMMDTGKYVITIDFGILAPVLFILMLVLASRYIKKDDRLVRSMDRLR
ncbi:MAG: DUF4293 family protein [Saprospiraceae bacterium]|nr:DUF4293 family protein [Saprospiraceae bacterium]